MLLLLIPLLLPGHLQSLSLRNVNSSWDLGFAQGQHFGTAIRAYLNSSNDLQTVLLPFCADAKNKTHCDTLQGNAERAFPDGVAELRGLAAGALVPEHWLWALNLADEIHSLRGGFPHTRTNAPPLAGAGGGACTALLNSSSPGTHFIAHNEDGGHCIAPPQYTYLLTVTWRAKSSAGSRAPFTAFVYPGSLPGYAFCATARGVGFTVNSEFVEATSVDSESGAPNVFLTRDLMESASADDAVRRARAYRAASGFTMNVGDASAGGRLMNVEVGPRGSVDSVAVVVRGDGGGNGGFLAHFNQYQRLSVPEYGDPSSDARAVTVRRLAPPLGASGALAILGDTSNAQHLNIWRDYKFPRVDACKTVASVVLDFATARSMCVFTRNPRVFPQPQVCFPIGG